MNLSTPTKQRTANFSGSVFIATLLASLFGLSGCSETSPKFVPKPVLTVEKVKNVGGTKVTFNPKVDILFVVDDSGSMSTHQQNLANNIRLFTAGITKNQLLDYHIGVVTSSIDGFSTSGTGDGKLVGTPNFVERNTAGGLGVLETNLVVGTSGSSTEKFFDPVQAALSLPLLAGQNAGFYRPDAHLAVVFITDADDQSEKMNPDSFFQFLVDLKTGDTDKILSYGVFIPVNDNTCDRSGEDPPARIERYMTIASGKSFGLCDQDFGQKLAGLADDLVDRVGKVMLLSRPPAPGSIEVTYGTQVIPNDAVKGWTYDPVRNGLLFGNGIEFTEQPAGTQVEVNFVAAQYD